MSYNRVRTPKFYIDAVLLARQWGAIKSENIEGFFYLNPSKLKGGDFTNNTNYYFDLVFENRYWCNSLTDIFILGHNFKSDNITINFRITDESNSNESYLLTNKTPNLNGWSYYRLSPDTSVNYNKIRFKTEGISEQVLSFGEISAGWSYAMPHSPDLELTQGISNKSIKTQTTKGGHTLTNAGYNQQPNWIRQPWTTGTTNTVAEGRTVFPVGRRSWNLKFSYISDTDLFPSSYNSASGIFQWSGTDPDTGDAGTNFFIKDNFVDKVYHGTNGFQLPFIFQPDSNTEEYAICRINNDSISFKQVANNVYDVNLDIIEVW